MSGAAEGSAKAFTHRKASVRDLLDAIAREIPEGQTTTGVIALDVLAAKARQHERTARTNRDLLVTLEEITVHDGGRGNKARYEMLHVTGTRPAIETPLPLRADLRPVRRPKASRQTSGDLRTLFDETSDRSPDVWAYTVGSITRRLHQMWANVGSITRRLVSHLPNVGSITRRLGNIPPDVSLPLDVDGTRAREELLLKEVLLLPATAEPLTRPPPDPNPSHCRWFPKTHAWCAGQRSHLPAPLDEDFRRSLGRLPGETDDAQRVRAWAIYAAEDAKIPADAPTSLNGFDHWRPILAAVLARAAPIRPGPNPRAAPDRDLYALAELQRRQRQGSSTGCGHPTNCASYDDHKARVHAEVEAAQRERKSG